MTSSVGFGRQTMPWKRWIWFSSAEEELAFLKSNSENTEALIVQKRTAQNFVSLDERRSIAALRLARPMEGHGRQPDCGCLAFAAVRNSRPSSYGVNRRGELEEVAAALTQIADRMDEFGPVPAIDPIYLDPSRWPSFNQRSRHAQHRPLPRAARTRPARDPVGHANLLEGAQPMGARRLPALSGARRRGLGLGR